MKSKQYLGSRFIILALFAFVGITQAQTSEDYSGVWAYEVKDTPYGDYFGKMYLDKDGASYTGKFITSKEVEYKLKVVRVKGGRMLITSDIEETNSTISGTFDGDSLKATVEVEGDGFLYTMKAKRVDKG